MLCMTCVTMVFAQVENTKIGAQEFTGEIVIEADKAAIWSILTNVDEFCKIMGYRYLDGARVFDKVGVNSQLEDYGDKGTLILTKFVLNEELRFSWDPDNASYLCTERWTLTTNGNNTSVKLVLRYSESGPQSAEAISEQVEHYNTALAKLKRKAEY